MSSDAFIAALKRFFTRRSRSSIIFSDNATNFVGASRELTKLYNHFKNPDESLGNYLTFEEVKWNFFPPRAPYFGGLWEAGVRSFKYHLKRVVGETKLTYEEFLTVTLQIEAILNSRPITPLPADDDCIEALTSGHFLIFRPITAISEPELL
ncbi:uncharacterized protein LOC118192545 [Stegodyphus dumicola]|uniref:uncharacterized protein LOC118192545 n=1 Tax=Stegodyphus dumicola TaxID=202533 RepID=UPI0015B254BE|nr:uncharacterized protein LOC118192545 [Stegodyphus dumicola]